MTDTEKDIHTEAEQPTADASRRGGRLCVWLSVVLALVSWAVLMWSDGYVALGVALAAIVAGGIGASRAGTTLRRVAVTAIIAAGVLAIVVSAYIIVLKFII